MSNLSSIYQDFLISSYGKIEVTKFSKILGKGFSHDRFTKQLLLNDTLDDDTKLWEHIKPFLRDYENKESGCIIVDDSLLHKPYSKTNDVVCWHYDHVSGKSVKGIMMLNFQYTDDSGISIPLGYEIITKTEDKWSDEYQKYIKKSKFTKNEIMRDKLQLLHFNNEVKYKYILMDKWFTTSDNIEFIDGSLKKKFIAPIKKNRKVALSLEDKNKGRYVSIDSIDMGACSSRLIYLKGCDIPLNIGKQIVKNGNDGELTYLYLVTNDIDLSFNQTLEIYQRRWKIEEYHKSLKQNLKIEHSPTKVELSQRNHINLTVLAFIKLEKLRLNYKMNHFALKEKIYIEALKVAYKKVGELDCT
ncbi:MAG: transposase [Campylobacterota bacterium]|nr:transposase [Campylobacterota bacterium]